MSPESALRLVAVGFAVAGIVYVCADAGFWDRTNSSWWRELPRHKRIVLGLAVAATVLQSFI
jgi:hypothetical protein